MTNDEILRVLPQIVREFAAYKSAIQGCSPKTVTEYLIDLRTFFRYLIAKENGIDPESEEFTELDASSLDLTYIKDIKKDDIYDFLLYSGTTRGNLWSAKSRKLSAIKAFFKYLVNSRGLLEENPAATVESPKPKRSLPKFLSLEESQRLLEAIRADEASDSLLRDYAIVTLFLNCGMRLSELCGVNLNDIDRELRSMRVIGKGAKERIIYLNNACRASLADYLEERLSPTMRARAAKKKEERALFLSSRGQRISPKTVQWMVYKYLELAGLEAKHYSVHKLRHTAATLMYQSGNVDIRVLKDILGHEQLNTTQIYTHVSDRNMEEAMQKNPLADLGGARKDPSELPGDTAEVSNAETILSRNNKELTKSPTESVSLNFDATDNINYWINTFTERQKNQNSAIDPLT
ncbi:MAG: tyrosine recombinase XerC [Clostridia bacterium]|nr:tyrosine recombinase XerC [Clostridia bacterium]